MFPIKTLCFNLSSVVLVFNDARNRERFERLMPLVRFIPTRFVKIGIFHRELITNCFPYSISSLFRMSVLETKCKSGVHESTFRSLEYRLIASRLHDLDSLTRKQTYPTNRTSRKPAI